MRLMECKCSDDSISEAHSVDIILPET